MIRLPRKAFEYLERHGYVVSFLLNKLKDEGMTFAYYKDPRNKRIHVINWVRYRCIGFYVNYEEFSGFISDILPFTGYDTLNQLWGAYHMANHLRYNTYALYYVHESMLPEILRAMIA